MGFGDLLGRLGGGLKSGIEAYGRSIQDEQLFKRTGMSRQDYNMRQALDREKAALAMETTRLNLDEKKHSIEDHAQEDARKKYMQKIEDDAHAAIGAGVAAVGDVDDTTTRQQLIDQGYLADKKNEIQGRMARNQTSDRNNEIGEQYDADNAAKQAEVLSLRLKGADRENALDEQYAEEERRMGMVAKRLQIDALNDQSENKNAAALNSRSKKAREDYENDTMIQGYDSQVASISAGINSNAKETMEMVAFDAERRVKAAMDITKGGTRGWKQGATGKELDINGLKEIMAFADQNRVSMQEALVGTGWAPSIDSRAAQKLLVDASSGPAELQSQINRAIANEALDTFEGMFPTFMKKFNSGDFGAAMTPQEEKIIWKLNDTLKQYYGQMDDWPEQYEQPMRRLLER